MYQGDVKWNMMERLSGTRELPMTPEVRAICEGIVKNRKKPKVEPVIKGHARFLFFDKEGKPMVVLHWEKYMQHAVDKKIYTPRPRP